MNFTKADTTIKCQTCANEYYLSTDQTQCIKGSLNCDIYTDKDNCARCKNKFHASTACDKEHATIADCEVYSRSANNTCLKCSAMKAPFVMTEECKSYTPLTGCSEHIVDTSGTAPVITCKTCSKGYFLTADKKCAANSTKNDHITDCLTYNIGGCTECVSGKYLTNDWSTSTSK